MKKPYREPRQKSIDGSLVIVQENQFEKAFRQFKKKILTSGLLQDLRDREAYTKPTALRKKKASDARRRWLKKLEGSKLPKKLY